MFSLDGTKQITEKEKAKLAKEFEGVPSPPLKRQKACYAVNNDSPVLLCVEAGLLPGNSGSPSNTVEHSLGSQSHIGDVFRLQSTETSSGQLLSSPPGQKNKSGL